MVFFLISLILSSKAVAFFPYSPPFSSIFFLSMRAIFKPFWFDHCMVDAVPSLPRTSLSFCNKLSYAIFFSVQASLMSCLLLLCNRSRGIENTGRRLYPTIRYFVVVFKWNIYIYNACLLCLLWKGSSYTQARLICTSPKLYPPSSLIPCLVGLCEELPSFVSKPWLQITRTWGKKALNGFHTCGMWKIPSVLRANNHIKTSILADVLLSKWN